jgi:RNase H-fold protein (predicted Holliday junction resolvase)
VYKVVKWERRNKENVISKDTCTNHLKTRMHKSIKQEVKMVGEDTKSIKIRSKLQMKMKDRKKEEEGEEN